MTKALNALSLKNRDNQTAMGRNMAIGMQASRLSTARSELIRPSHRNDTPFTRDPAASARKIMTIDSVDILAGQARDFVVVLMTMGTGR